MGTITTIIHVGSGHPYHGGINPTHVMYLSENSRPIWILTEYLPEEKPLIYRCIPHSPKFILEDAFALIGWIIMKDHRFTHYFNQDPLPGKLMHFPNETDPDHTIASGLIKQVFSGSSPKIMISFLDSRKIPQDAYFLKDIPQEVCILTTAYSRTYNVWDKKFDEIGDIPDS